MTRVAQWSEVPCSTHGIGPRTTDSTKLPSHRSRQIDTKLVWEDSSTGSCIGSPLRVIINPRYAFSHFQRCLMNPVFRHSGRPSTGKKAVNPDSYKTVMCQAWLESKMCAFGENCRFAHGEAELRPVRSVPCQINKYKTKLCDKYTTTGLCPYGDRCLFIHPDHGTNAYIRPDKLVEVSRRHALADMQFLASLDPTHTITPSSVSYLPGHPPITPILPPPAFHSHLAANSKALYNRGGVMFGSCGNSTSGGQTRPQLRPHPSWPLEPSTFFKEKTDEFRTPSPADVAITGGKGKWLIDQVWLKIINWV
ncbi:unnamed protein product [Angiostrongylus costaricensis]|uniref:C3H1-type domain-containing protein n=1 Tax=Angiostrongylus costaricensis TaxID=334426 RepID=A0A0R3PVM7_ANGCS|nr:unnamed protein product [Angiostrongylus costaricensis]